MEMYCVTGATFVNYPFWDWTEFMGEGCLIYERNENFLYLLSSVEGTVRFIYLYRQELQLESCIEDIFGSYIK